MLDNEATELVRAKPNPLNFLSQNSMVSLGILRFGDDFRERSQKTKRFFLVLRGGLCGVFPHQNLFWGKSTFEVFFS